MTPSREDSNRKERNLGVKLAQQFYKNSQNNMKQNKHRMKTMDTKISAFV